ncbi:MAG TPA: flagellar filament capping protein FliD [Geminicoccaceae bacterium]|nr:flagellar filament capping protein FliD [Geminicoccus sp.]HMU50752.1 flagellar filament capping protein FliD [Geminicoccaceae bacterium]
MATSAIDFGSLSSTGTTSRLSGTSSGIDTEAMVEALTQTKLLPAERLESRITENDAKIAAYAELRTLLADLSSAVEGMRNPPGFLGRSQNLFEAKEAYFSSDTSTSPSTLLAVTPDATADIGSHEVVVHQLATARKLMADGVADRSVDLASVLNDGTAFTGSFTLGLAGGDTATIAVDGGMSLDDLREAINATSSTSGVTASVLRVSASEHRLVLTANATGKEVVMTPAGGDDVLGIVGLSDDGGATLKNPIQEPLQARVEIDGVMLTRDSNRITDAVDGLSLDLYRAEPGTTVTVEVGRSLAGVKEQVGAFVDAYNALRDFVARHNRFSDDGGVDDEAVLFGDTTLRSISQTLDRIVTGRVDGLAADAPASLGALGITLDESNHLEVDDTKLDAKLLGSLDELRKVFEFSFTSSSPDLQLFARPASLADTSFTVDIVDADADGIPESATIDGVAVDIDGTTLVGRTGTPYAGLELIWSGKGSTSIDVTATSGIAERLYNEIEKATRTTGGMLATASESLETQSTRYRRDIDKIEQRAEDFRLRLIEKFSAMETALSMAKAMLQQISATTEAMFADD